MKSTFFLLNSTMQLVLCAARLENPSNFLKNVFSTDITSIHQSLTLGIKGQSTAKGNKVISWVVDQITDHCHSNSNRIAYIFLNLYILALHTLILMHTHQISRQELGPPTVGLNLIPWAKETLTAIKPRVKFSKSAFTAESATSSVADAQQESIW